MYQYLGFLVLPVLVPVPRTGTCTGTMYYSTTSTTGVNYTATEFRSVLPVASFRIMMHDSNSCMGIDHHDLLIHLEQSALTIPGSVFLIIQS